MGDDRGDRASAADAALMGRALELAEQGWGRVHPNPLVGALVARQGEVVGEGAHREFGGPHAEVEALGEAADRARGATLYVTLEPCAHQGKTPACTDAILRAGITRLVYAAEDPHPAAAGGADRLRASGLQVVGGVLREEARRQNALFLLPIERGRPFVTLKYGLSLDARLAAAEGQRTRITGDAAEAEVHRLRSGYDAILVGARTARIDDPLLTVRDAPAPRVAPIRLVADPGATLPPGAKLARSAREVPVWILAAEDAPKERADALEALGVELVRCPTDQGLLDLPAALDRLYDRGVGTIFCEGGARLGGALLDADRVDRLHLIYAPVVFGDAGVRAFRRPGGNAGGNAGGTGGTGGTGEAAGWPAGRLSEVRRLGPDVLMTLERSA